MQRRCGMCGQSKPIDDFAWRRRKQGQRDNYCRPCRAEYKRMHYAANKARYIANAKRRTDRTVAERTEFLLAFFRTHPCADCGETDPLVLEFDHRSDKHFGIASGIRARAWQSVLDEIAKCDVVCANCHRRRTARRGGFLRALLVEGTSEDDCPPT